MKVYFSVFMLFIFQMYSAKIFSIWGSIPDFLTVFILIFTLKHNISNSLKVALFVGVLQDMINPVSFPVNTLCKSFIVFFVSNIKEKFYYSSVIIKFFLILVITVVDTVMKVFITYISTGVMDVSFTYLVIVLVNFLTFYLVSIFYEVR